MLCNKYMNLLDRHNVPGIVIDKFIVKTRKRKKVVKKMNHYTGSTEND